MVNTPFEDSYEAFYELDLTGPENEDVVCGSFIWNRGKSNENLGDSRSGKGFSFYYARYVFQDENKVYVQNKQDTGNLIVVGEVEYLLAVVHTVKDKGRIRIISAWAVNDDSWYAKSYSRKNYCESMSNTGHIEYCMVRKLDIDRIRPEKGAYPRVIRLNDLDFPPINKFYSDLKGTPVYVQTIGDREKCEKLCHVVTVSIDHGGYGFNW